MCASVVGESRRRHRFSFSRVRVRVNPVMVPGAVVNLGLAPAPEEGLWPMAGPHNPGQVLLGLLRFF